MTDLSTCSPAQFLEALDRRHLEGKRELIDELADRRDERSIEILIAVLHGRSWYLRERAVLALARMGEAAVPYLSVLLDGGVWYTRAAVAEALGRMGYVGALPGLVKLAREENRTVHEAALGAVAELVLRGADREAARFLWEEGSERAIAVGREMLESHPEAGKVLSDLFADPSTFLAPAAPKPRPEVVPADEDAPSEIRQKA